MTEIAFDDLEGLRASITKEWSDWGPEYEMTQEKVNQFPELTGDHQWIHVDVERANAGPLAARSPRVLHPQPAALLNRTGAVRITGQANVVNYGADGLRMLAPVPVGSTLHARNHHRCPRAQEGHAGGPPGWPSTWWATTTFPPCSTTPSACTRADPPDRARYPPGP
ncbi:MAG: hypothetical protein Ct9H300mP12_05950 [Acidimicrobiales bacterium]|nr:MAG: hypothetical protein Ct9H300mP12_05950 [Acidimicrobiales bacterium]